MHKIVAVILTLYGSLVIADERKEVSTHVIPPEIQWQQSPFGPEVWSASGDFTEGGAHITYIKFPAGMKTPLHVHSAEYTGIVIAGTTRHTIRGKRFTKKRLPQGSHWTIPPNVEHVSECLSGFECIMVIFQSSAFDFVPVE